jgi:L-ascorbate metabolism protein UlaG (beta-lactamase superfamily)
MQGSTATEFYSGSQVIGMMREKCRQFMTTSPRVHEVSPQYEAPESFQAGGAKIRIFPLSHGTRKYARIQNNGHLIELGGLTVLHVGDAAMDATDYARAGMEEVDIDVALIPFWYFQPGPGAEVIEKYINARFKIAVHIPPGEMAEVKEYMQQGFPQVMILEDPLDQVEFTAPAPPPH